MRSVVAIGMCLCLSTFGAAAREDAKEAKIFSCAIGAKQVSVVKSGNRFVYRFGTAARSDITVVGDPAGGNIFRMRQRFAGPETQVRFTNGDFSYVVFAAEGSPSVGARSIAGVTVMRGSKQISFLTCDRFTEFQDFDRNFSGAPEDDAAHSAM